MCSKNFLANILLLTLFIFNESEAKTYTRCELVNIFRANGMPNTLANWVCLAESESSRRSERKSGRNSNGSYDYGLFQINSKYWCTGEATVSNDCGTSCSNFLNNDLSDDIRCAVKVYNRHGFAAWYGWRNSCQGRDLSAYVAGC